jgi:malonate decarboxylase gamma subunit
MNKIEEVCNQLFPLGYELDINNDTVSGVAKSGSGQVALIGTANQAAIGADLAFELSSLVLRLIETAPKIPIIILVDTQGQKLSKRDELLGNASYLSHLSKTFELARNLGHQIISIIYNEAVSGGYLVLGLIADQSFALSDAQIRVMALPAMSRITQIPLEKLEELCKSSAIFAPGPENYYMLGAIEKIDDKSISSLLEDAIGKNIIEDDRPKLGYERGGRKMAHSIIESIVNA